MPEVLEYNTKGRLCSLNFGEPCPGFAPGFDPKFDKNDPPENERPGCPHWMQMTVETLESPQDMIWTGCAIMMMPFLMVGLTKTNQSSAVAVETSRNEIAKGFKVIDKTLQVEMTQVANTLLQIGISEKVI